MRERGAVSCAFVAVRPHTHTLQTSSLRLVDPPTQCPDYDGTNTRTCHARTPMACIASESHPHESYSRYHSGTVGINHRPYHPHAVRPCPRVPQQRVLFRRIRRRRACRRASQISARVEGWMGRRLVEAVAACREAVAVPDGALVADAARVLLLLRV